MNLYRKINMYFTFQQKNKKCKYCSHLFVRLNKNKICDDCHYLKIRMSRNLEVTKKILKEIECQPEDRTEQQKKIVKSE